RERLSFGKKLSAPFNGTFCRIANPHCDMLSVGWALPPRPTCGMKVIFKDLISLVVLASVLLASVGRAAEEIKVPFNFQWGEAAQRLEDSLKRVQARVVDRKKVRNRQCLVVEGIPQRLLQRALFYFDSDSLNEIELHYGDGSWDSNRYGTFFDQTRRNIEAKYGVGRVVARQKTRDGDVLETLIGYQWTQDTTTLVIYYYTAESGDDSYRLLSLHYRGY
ncbi:MAG TPA: hypothetical protein VIT23_06575, partial [Terrimicrobiaceae bacterium]